ncbi:uncharacterized protein J3D65DRAFT_394337 [Phyllosticta citribraziliensis]|uniref:Uncharacterized protein n=1 Tax=Phyllosticta citribraziliensis TaxID=989973 RepID=A0ABR1LL39_9PEZI
MSESVVEECEGGREMRKVGRYSRYLQSWRSWTWCGVVWCACLSMCGGGVGTARTRAERRATKTETGAKRDPRVWLSGCKTPIYSAMGPGEALGKKGKELIRALPCLCSILHSTLALQPIQFWRSRRRRPFSAEAGTSNNKDPSQPKQSGDRPKHARGPRHHPPLLLPSRRSISLSLSLLSSLLPQLNHRNSLQVPARLQAAAGRAPVIPIQSHHDDRTSLSSPLPSDRFPPSRPPPPTASSPPPPPLDSISLFATSTLHLPRSTSIATIRSLSVDDVFVANRPVPPHRLPPSSPPIDRSTRLTGPHHVADTPAVNSSTRSSHITKHALFAKKGVDAPSSVNWKRMQPLPLSHPRSSSTPVRIA